jgi:hypothetical protein
MNKTKIIKLLQNEIYELERTPTFSSSATNKKIATEILARQHAIEILNSVLYKIEEKDEKKPEESDYNM